jgi:hypothetical protein
MDKIPLKYCNNLLLYIVNSMGFFFEQFCFVWALCFSFDIRKTFSFFCFCFLETWELNKNELGQIMIRRKKITCQRYFHYLTKTALPLNGKKQIDTHFRKNLILKKRKVHNCVNVFRKLKLATECSLIKFTDYK